MPRHRRISQAIAGLALALTLAALALAAGLPLAAAEGSPFGDRVPGQRVYDRAGLLTPAEVADLERRAAAVEQAGAPTVVYLQARTATYDDTLQDAQDLMNAWDVQSAPGAHDGLVVLLNLDPSDPRHGQAVVFAGAKHVRGNLPQSEIERIFNQEMRPRLRAGETAAGIAAGLDAIAHDLAYGPPPPSRPVRLAREATDGPLSPLNLAAAALAAALAALLLRAHQPRRAAALPAPPTATPPSDLSPAQAGALVAGRVTDAQMEATLLDLARRGALALEPAERRQVRLRLLDGDVVRDDVEAALWDALASLAGPDGTLEPRALRRLRSAWRPAKDALRRDLEERGWFDPAAGARRRPLYLAAAVALVAAVVALGVTAVGGHPWGLVGVTLLLFAGLAGIVLGYAVPATTPAGESEAAAWSGYRAGLLAAARDPDHPLDLDAAMPYAVALGAARSLDKRLKQAGERGYVPLWLGRTLEPAAWDGGFYPYWAAFHGSVSSTSSGGTGGGGGAAAGGAGAGGSF